MKLKQMLKGKLSEEELESLVSSFDIIGSIAVIEIPDALKEKEKLIAEEIMALNKNIKTVCKRAGEHSGEFRIRPVEVIAGEKTTETYYVESGVRMHLDVNKVYFTPRLSFERSRIASLVKEKEVVGAWFAGVGPFALVIFKKQPDAKIYAVELNPDAYEYMVENIRINKAQSAITPVFGDVREKAKKLPKFDRIIMPLPKGAETFLDSAFDSSKENSVIHFYAFGDAKNPFEKTENIIFKIAGDKGKKIEVLNKRVVRPFSPNMVQVVFDIKTL